MTNAEELGIKFVGCDQDGVLTDSRYNVSDNGVLTKSFNTRDFWAIGRLVKAGIQVRIITTATDNVLEHKISHVTWASSSNFGYAMGIKNKKEWLSEWLAGHGLDWKNVAYVGDAEGDLDCLQSAFVSACPFDAVPIIREVDDIVVLDQKGGDGAIYEFVQWLLYGR